MSERHSEHARSGFRQAGRALAAAAIAFGLLGGTVVIDENRISISDNAAFAKGGNGGGGKGGRGGRGGGNGGGQKSSGNDVASADDRHTGTGRGHAKGHGHGHGHSRGRSHESDDSGTRGTPSGTHASASENGISAAALGSLNAARASPMARQNVSPNSMVGHITAFAEAVESSEIEAAARALAAKANKAITEPVVMEVARHAQVDIDQDTAKAIAEQTARIQAGESPGPNGDSTPSGS